MQRGSVAQDLLCPGCCRAFACSLWKPAWLEGPRFRLGGTKALVFGSSCCELICVSPLEAFPDHMADLHAEGLGSEKGSVHGSQPDLRRITDLPVPADFLSLSNDTKPKLMTPDAFMTPSTSLQQVTREQHPYGQYKG